jgi:hypothetical protein
MDISPPFSSSSATVETATTATQTASEAPSFYQRVLKLHQAALPKGFQGPAALLCAAATSASMLVVDWCVMMYYEVEEVCRKRNAAVNEPKNE